MPISNESKDAIRREIESSKMNKEEAKKLLDAANLEFERAKNRRDGLQTQVNQLDEAISKMKKDLNDSDK